MCPIINFDKSFNKEVYALENSGIYASWSGYSVLYNDAERSFSLKCQGKTNAIKNLKIESINIDGKSIGSLENFKKSKCNSITNETDAAYLTVDFSKGCTDLEKLKLKFTISDDGIDLTVSGRTKCTVILSGEMNWGNGKPEDVYPMSSQTKGSMLRAAVGPASSNKDDMLFDRLSDKALLLSGMENIRINYDWNKKKYTFKAESGDTLNGRKMGICVRSALLTNQYGIKYSPLNKDCTFRKPPAGWMTWYSVKFNACEEKVLKNAKWMSENLKEYGAEAVWVDWEWCHKDMSGIRDDGCDCFNPDKEKYPRGLKYVSDKIKEMGLVPALWMGLPCDSSENEYIKENPEIILAHRKEWCGQYFLDFSHPKYLNEFLPKALACVPKWGYEAVKCDILPLAMVMHEEHHQKMYDPTLTTKEAYRKMIKKVRSILGDKYYMLSCAAVNDRDVLWGADIFDSARVGADIFKWEEFLKQGVGRTMRYYPLHNNVLYPDSDNVVMREEFNDIKQAASRIYFVSMLGLPMTFGDEFDALDEKRISFIKECLPVLETHPMDIYKLKMPDRVLKMNLAINKEWESYNVVNVFNMLPENSNAEIDLATDLGLDSKEYIVYNYTDDKLVDITDKSFFVALSGSESKIFSIRERINRPQIISTSRHISQGAAEIRDMYWNDSSSELLIMAELIKSAPYTLTIYVPDDFETPEDLVRTAENVYKKTVISDIGGLTEIKISFRK